MIIERRRAALGAILLASLFAPAGAARAQAPDSSSPEGFAIKIFRVESAFYPFVNVYFRSFDRKTQRPLVNLNELNIGVMVKGRSYDPMKRQYRLMTIRGRNEATRSVLVLDCSETMKGEPFKAALRAAAAFIDAKRPQDQVAILAIRDTAEGYETVSGFERDPGDLARRLADVQCDGKRTRLYDSILGAMELCATSAQGGTNSNQGEFIISNSIVVLSDGKDEGSALSREELNSRITRLPIPIPVYSLAYSKLSTEYFKNLESVSKNSFGIYYGVGEAMNKLNSCVEDVQNILQSDYVATIRCYVPVDGEKHAIKLGIEYPSGSGQVRYESGEFEAIEPPPLKPLQEAIAKMNQMLPALPDGNPFLSKPAPAAGGEK